jgi:hypothetical protein
MDFNLYYIGIPFLFGTMLFVIQLVCEVRKTTTTPGTVLTSISTHLQKFFKRLGSYVAYLSSYLQWLKLETVYDAAMHLLTPTVGILLSWTYFFAGYFKACFSYAAPFAIYIGTFLPIAIAATLIACYTNWFPITLAFLMEKVGPDAISVVFGISLIVCGMCFIYYNRQGAIKKEEYKDKNKK